MTTKSAKSKQVQENQGGKAGRPRKFADPLRKTSVQIPEPLAQWLDAHCAATGESRNDAITAGLRMYRRNAERRAAR